MPQSKVVWVIAAIGIIVIAGGIWWWSSMSGPTVVPLVANDNGTVSPQPMPSTSDGGQGTAAATAPSNSDASLNSDLSNIDAQMNDFSSDSASIDQGLNDKPIPQS